MGRFATGVTIVTTELNGQVHGMTANGFMSVSLDPPLVLVSMGNNSNMHKLLPQSLRYGVSFLAQDHERLSTHFAGRPQEGLEVDWVRKADMPLIANAIGHIVTRVVAAHLAGDHTLYVGEVEHLDFVDDDPLLFYAGKYRQLAQSGS
jgi:flavin reductase (DIM6/NTAB) family NADH-FMN oxidoreductase RutF